MIQHPSPNFDERPEGLKVDMLVLHYTGMKTAKEAFDRLISRDSAVSAHYAIGEDGVIHRMVGEKFRAWHAGSSSWRGHKDINSRSIGIELVNPGHEFGYRPFPAKQMKSLAHLAHDIIRRHKEIPARNIVGHSDVAPTRKQDPGELFDWAGLAKIGIGFWPFKDRGQTDAPPSHLPLAEVQKLLAKFGYGVPQNGQLDDETVAVITAFQRHFRPARVDGVLDVETVARLAVAVEGVK